jgi:aspartate carbamoyltransferase regulatory subunit
VSGEGCRGGLLVRRIEEGTVVDHIPPGRAVAVLKVLRMWPPKPNGHRVAVVFNAESRKMGRKDLVKIEGYHVTREEAAAIALVAPRATVNVIREGRVAEKWRVEPPREVVGLLQCPNPTCITRKEGEPVKPRMVRAPGPGLRYRCVYCGSTLEHDMLERYLLIG